MNVFRHIKLTNRPNLLMLKNKKWATNLFRSSLVTVNLGQQLRQKWGNRLCNVWEKKMFLPTQHSSALIYSFRYTSGLQPIGRTGQWFDVRIKQHVPTKIQQGNYFVEHIYNTYGSAITEHLINNRERYPWCNGYRRREWIRWHEFKSWTRLIAFHIAPIPLGKVWIQLFSLQLWKNSRAD